MVTSYFNFPVPKVPENSDPKLADLLEPIYAGFNAIYNNFVYSCGVVSPPASEYARLSTVPTGTLQPQNLNRLYVLADGPLPFGTIVQLVNSAGTVAARAAKGGAAGDAARAIGYCNTAGGVTSGSYAEIIVGSGLLGVAGVTVGTKYYLSETPGALALAAPASGIIQPVGYGVMPNYIFLNFFQG